MLGPRLIFGLVLAFFVQADVIKDHDPRLKTAVILDTPTTGASTTPEGRTFLKLARVDGTTGSQVVEVIGNNYTLVSYPNDAWNSWNSSTDSQADSEVKYVSTNAQRIGPDGRLWVIDSGCLAKFPNSSKLISFNVTTNEVDRVYYLGNITTTGGSINDVRFNGKYAYLTEYTIGSIIVLDLETGYARMVLREHKSTVALMPLSAEGQLMRDSATGLLEYINADQLEVSPDGKYFYYQPGSGYMWRIETKYLSEALHNNTMADLLPNHVEPFSLTPSTGGTAIDAEGNIYYSDGDRQEIRYIAPNGTTTLLVHDSRLLWVDAMWIDTQQRLWMCASQLNHGDLFVQPNNESNTIKKPIYVYTIETGHSPSPLDHA
jgi:sugar lactone lactonase YvrE